MNDYQRAIDLYEELMKHRRYFHKYPEVGIKMPMAKQYIKQQLERIKIPVYECGSGLVAMIGKGSPCILLRADMDALPMKEESGLPFASINGNAHTCGHDFHAAMLLGAAKLLKQEEDMLKGSIKLVFQAGEESLQGAMDMIQHQVLENPKVDVAFALHVAAGNIPLGVVMYQSKEVMMAATCRFKITIFGKSGHGAYPQKGIDAIFISNQIMNAIYALVSKETDLKDRCIITIGKIYGGENYNIICDEITLEGSIRSFHDESIQYLKKRMKQFVLELSTMYHAEGMIYYDEDIPALICNHNYTNQFIEYIKELKIPNLKLDNQIQASASDDFACITSRIPGVYLYISAGIKNHPYYAHHPKVLFHEDALIYGVAYLTHVSKRYLQDHHA